MRLQLLYIGLFILISQSVIPQIQDDNSINNVAEKIQTYLSNDYIPDQLIEDLEALQQNPVNINSATSEELERIFFLSRNQIKALINYRKINGSILSIYELQAITLFDIQTIQLIQPFIVISSPTPSSHKNYLNTSGYQRLTTTLETPKGYLSDSTSEAKYQGGNYQVLSKINISYGEKIDANWIIEKDKGERFINPKSNTIDFISASIAMQNVWKLDRIIIGDYKIKFGQGLIANSNQSMGKSMPFDGVALQNECFTAYRSTNETRFFRGVAVSKQIGAFSLNTFYSQLKKDATLETSTNGSSVFSNLATTGLHRTSTEIDKTKNISEKAFGGEIKYHNDFSEISIHTLNTLFNIPFLPANRPDKIGVASGKRFNNTAASYRISLKNLSLFGEIATDIDLNIAKLIGLNVYPNDFTTCQIIYRQFPNTYFTLYGDAFGEGSLQNEEGYFLKIIITPFAKTTFTGYVDLYNFPGIRYNEVSPGKGKELYFRADYTPNSNTSLYFQIKHEIQDQKTTNSNPTIAKTEIEKRWQSTLNLTTTLSDQLKSKTKILATYYDFNTPSKGLLLLQDVSWRPLNKPYQLNVRYAIFDTDDYNSRLYAYENGLSYTFTIPAYAGKGQRIYVVGKWKIAKRVTLEGKLGRFTYWHVNEIGTANDRIDGNHKTEASAQIKWKF